MGTESYRPELKGTEKNDEADRHKMCFEICWQDTGLKTPPSLGGWAQTQVTRGTPVVGPARLILVGLRSTRQRTQLPIPSFPSLSFFALLSPKKSQVLTVLTDDERARASSNYAYSSRESLKYRGEKTKRGNVP